MYNKAVAKANRLAYKEFCEQNKEDEQCPTKPKHRSKYDTFTAITKANKLTYEELYGKEGMKSYSFDKGYHYV